MAYSLRSSVQRARSEPSGNIIGEALKTPEKIVEDIPAPNSDPMFANCYLLVRNTQQGQSDVILPLNQEVLLTILKLCLDNCSVLSKLTSQPSVAKAAGVAEMLTSFSKPHDSGIESFCSPAAEKDLEASTDSALATSATSVAVVTSTPDVLDLSLISGVCNPVSNPNAMRDQVLENSMSADNEEDEWTDVETLCGDEADNSMSTCVFSTPRRSSALDAGFDRFWKSVSPDLHKRYPNLQRVEEDIDTESQVSTQTDMASFDLATQTQRDTTIDSLEELADEPQAVLCSEFNWLFHHKRIRDTLLSIGATQSVLYEIMMRNRYYEDCDRREQRMIVDTCKVRRAVELANGARRPVSSKSKAKVQSPLRPSGYTFSESEDEDCSDDCVSVGSLLTAKVRAKTPGRPRGRARKSAQPAKRSRVSVNTEFDAESRCSTPAPVMEEYVGLSQLFDAVLEPGTIMEPVEDNSASRIQPKRGAKDVAKVAILTMFSLAKRRVKSFKPARKVKAPSFSIGFKKRSSANLQKPRPTPKSKLQAESDLNRSLIIRSRKRRRSLKSASPAARVAV